MLSEEDTKHIAKLARLGLSEEEVKKFSGQLTDILGYMELLNEVDVEGVEPTSQVTGLMNVKREDKIDESCGKQALLDCTQLPVERGQIKVKPVITG
ncbi:Asp-tRNA(Asn)/Glu-tRNA(Gln) amidotransferase subunit GatC [Pseudomonadota bacterium]